MLGPSSPALAGGSWLETTKSHYAPGDRVVAVGYVQDSSEDGPFLANLGLTPIPEIPPDYSQSWQELGEVTIEDSGLNGYLANRVSIEFEVPADLPPGEYEVAVRNADAEFFGDLIGLTLYVGYDPEFERWIEWPLDEPLIADLAPDDVIAGPGWSVTVEDLIDGQFPADAARFMLEPESLPSPTVLDQASDEPTTTNAPATTTTTIVRTSTPSAGEAERPEVQHSANAASQTVLPADDTGTDQSPLAIIVLAAGLGAVAGGGVLAMLGKSKRRA